MNETLALIHHRASCRSFEDRDLSEETKTTLLNAALRAPTAGNLVYYSVIQVEDPALKARLAETCDHQPFIAKSPFVLIFLADLHRMASLLDRDRASTLPPPSGVPLRYREGDLMLACSDALCAAQTAVLAAESLGLASCYIGDIMENAEEHRSLLALPPLTFPIAMLCFGYPKGRRDRGTLTERPPLNLVVGKDRYRELDTEELHRFYAHLEGAPRPGGAKTFAESVYLRKLASTFMEEMRRSVSLYLEDWREN